MPPHPPWQPGVSANPGGRPKGYMRFSDALKRQLAKTDRRDKTNIEKIAEKAVALALKGDMDAIRWIADRADGKVAQSISVESNQTVHVVPWLPALTEAAEALTDAAIDVEATDVEEAVEVEMQDDS